MKLSRSLHVRGASHVILLPYSTSRAEWNTTLTRFGGVRSPCLSRPLPKNLRAAPCYAHHKPTDKLRDSFSSSLIHPLRLASLPDGSSQGERVFHYHYSGRTYDTSVREEEGEEAKKEESRISLSISREGLARHVTHHRASRYDSSVSCSWVC